MRPHKYRPFMRSAQAFAEMSTCRRRQVGVVIANASLTKIVSLGYNGNYSGGPNECDREVVGNCGCLHAEDNALIKAPYGETLIMFTTLVPCETCAKRIINSSVRMVVYADSDYHTDGLALLKRAGIVTLHYPEEN